MKDLCIPIPNLQENDIVNIEVTVGERKIKYHFKIESFSWETNDELNAGADNVSKSLARIHRLKSAIENYDKNWEVMQIFNPADTSKYIQVLYREKLK